MITLIILTVLIILSGLLFSLYGFVINELPLLISSLSVVSASISGLIAIMVLKANKDKDRPFLIVKPNYNRYGSIQISVANYGTEIAIIENCAVDNEIILLRGEDFFEQIKGATISPGDSITFILIPLREYEEKNKDFSTKGKINYKNIKGKEYSNDILFNIEKLGPTAYNDDEERKMFFELQKIPKQLENIQKELLKSKKGNHELDFPGIKRNMSYISFLLTLMENGDYNKNITSDEKEAYHLMIMRDEGLINTTLWQDIAGNYIFRTPTLTWTGNDYLESLTKE